MKIGFFTDSYRPYISGVVRSIESFARELKRRGHEIYIFAPRYPSVDDDEANIYRFPSFRAPTYPDFYIGLPIPWPAQRYIRDWGLDVIHVHSPFMLGRLGAFFARRFDLPLVFTYHTLYDQYVHYFPIATGLVKKFVVSIAKDFCNKCDLVITPTDVIRDLLRGYGVTTSIIPVPTGIELSRFLGGRTDYLRKAFGIPEEDIILLFVGRIGKEKNLEYLLEAFSLVVREAKNVVLVLVGSGPEMEHLKVKSRELGVVEKVVFTGFLEPEKVATAYRSADIFVFPSVTETQGLVLAEAMAAGLPVVAQAAYGSLAMVKEGVTGYLCKEGKERFAELIILLVRDEELRKKMGAAARKRAEQLSADKMALRLEIAYNALITGNREAIEKLAEDEI
ncbi:MAG: glycosyltransferase family 4 protein [Thermacetogeniaceae bacterium]